MSFLTINGYHRPELFPIGFLLVETKIAERQINAGIATQATLMQLAIGSVLSKESGKAFQAVIKGLSNG